MKRIFIILCAVCTASLTFGQMKAKPSPIAIFVGDSAWVMNGVTTVSEVTNGLSVQGIEIKKAKISRYLNRTQALQQTSEKMPRFKFHIEEGVLSDFALIELSVKKDYRKFSSSELPRCRYKRVEPEHFSITPSGEVDFIVQPLLPLTQGEYVWVNLKQAPVNTFGDVVVWDFSIK